MNPPIHEPSSLSGPQETGCEPDSVRLKVLISAYSCEPGKGSEPEVGWRWSMQMARFHDVTVITRANNRESIEAGLRQLPTGSPRPTFVYFDGSRICLTLKRRSGLTRLYYLWWQRSLQEIVAQLCQEQAFDLIHHVTIAGYRYPTAIWGHGVPTLWGPVGGMESMDWRLLPFRHPCWLLVEALRHLNNLSSKFPNRARMSSLTITSTAEPHQVLERHGIPSRLMPAVGLDMSQFPEPPARIPCDKPLKLLFVGQLIWLKGPDLAIEALAASATDATLDLIGSGPFERGLRKLAQRLGVADRVRFTSRIPRSEVLARYHDHDVFLYPSLHDSGGFAVLEAMASQLPVICLDVGGPAMSVAEGCGFRIPLGYRGEVIAALATQIRTYHEQRNTLLIHGICARKQVAMHYDWNWKGKAMHEIYLSVTTRHPVSG